MIRSSGTPTRARALYLFPTKALAQDQTRYWRNAAGRAEGDPFEAAHIVVTNPETLRKGILPHRNELRRLQRLRKFHGSDPQLRVRWAPFGARYTDLMSGSNRLMVVMGSLCLAVGLLSCGGGSTFTKPTNVPEISNISYDGSWAGTNSTGTRLTFNVLGNSVGSATWRIQASFPQCNVGSACDTQPSDLCTRFVMPGLITKDNSFVAVYTAGIGPPPARFVLTFRGTFTSTRSAAGTWEYEYLDNGVCSGKGSFTWMATK